MNNFVQLIQAMSAHFSWTEISYLCIPLGLLYQAYRRIVSDRRADRREGAKDTFVNQLSDRMRDMQERGDTAIEDRAKIVGEKATLMAENHAQKEALELQRTTIEELEYQITVLQTSGKLLREQNRLWISTGKEGGL